MKNLQPLANQPSALGGLGQHSVVSMQRRIEIPRPLKLFPSVTPMTIPPPPTDWRSLHGSAFEGHRALVTGGAGFIGSLTLIAP